MTTRDQLLCGSLLWIACVVAWLIFLPALHGAFIFDDFPNLEGLSEISSDPGLYGFMKYALSGASGPLGRPLALASFALQHRSWPGHPQDFIYVNALVHLLNGCLLFWWLVRWQRLTVLQPGRAQHLLPLAISLLWLLTPMQANAVFYVVQRMAVLSATCTLTGLLLHTTGRDAAQRGSVARGYAMMTAGIAVGLGLGILSKESAALYPVLVLVYECTLLQAVARPPRWDAWSFAFLKLPTGLLLAYLGWLAVTIESAGLPRPASWERLLDESRILGTYLYKLLVPTLYGTRLMYDDYAALLMRSPVITAVCAVGWVAVATLAVRKRTVWPAFSFAILWFLGAHLLESTVIPLELAFEHRNYLAIIGPLTFLALTFTRLIAHPRVARVRGAVVSAGSAYGLFTALCMWQTAILWGSPTELALFWADRQPDSRRALQYAANSLVQAGAAKKAWEMYDDGAMRWPRDPVLPLTKLQTACAVTWLPMPDIGDIERRLRESDGHTLTTLIMIDGLLQKAEQGRCKSIPKAALRRLTEALLDSPIYAGLERFTFILNSRSAELDGDRKTAMDFLQRTIEVAPRIPLLQQAVLWSLEADDVEQARAYLLIAETSPGISPMARWSQRDEIKGLRQLIELYQNVMATPTPP